MRHPGQDGKKTYDFLIVGAGLFGAVFAHEASSRGLRCLVVEKRPQPGGNLYCQQRDGIQIHQYGAHIFHTKQQKVWDYVTALVEMRPYIHCPIAAYGDEVYNLPFNMNTFSRMWGIRTPAEAKRILDSQRLRLTGEAANLEEQALALVGHDIYEKLIRGYTEKQWGKPCDQLPAFIIRRIPVRFRYDNNYFDDPFQGIPVGGYNPLIEKLLADSDLLLETDFLAQREALSAQASRILYTGMLDAYYGYRYGALEYRSLRFETERLKMEDYQGVSVVNQTDRETPYTRTIEHKHFDGAQSPVTYITREYASAWEKGREAYYPVNDDANNALFAKYRALAAQEENVLFGGRLADYQYYDMDRTIAKALQLAEENL